VVEAVKQMTAHNDVMRSDRLKQVMQEIDPSFDEKDSGFSRFSKFVQEAAHRGLISTQLLDNGQYEIGLGPRAEGAPATPAIGRREAPVSAPAVKVETPAPPPAARPRQSSRVSDAFGLLKQALGRMGGEQPVSAEVVREAMNELAPEGVRRVEPRSMPKLLRQAHDADLIDLTRDEEGAYAVRVRQEEGGVKPPPASEPARSSEAEEEEPPMPTSSAPPPPYSQPSTPGSGLPVRSARFRRGSRGPRPAAPGVPNVGVVEVDPNFRPRVELIRHGRRRRRCPSRRCRGRRDESARDANGVSAVDAAGAGAVDVVGGVVRAARGGRGARDSTKAGMPAGWGRRHERASVPRARGGRGRGGRGRGERNGEERGEPMAVRPVAPPSAPAPTPAPASPAHKDEGDSFWTKVKRGPIGGSEAYLPAACSPLSTRDRLPRSRVGFGASPRE
jgi:hypothetical protein